MTHEELVEKVAREIHRMWYPFRVYGEYDTTLYSVSARAAIAAIYEAVKEPSAEQNNAARNWSAAKYGKPIGLDASRGCWSAMLSASPLNNELLNRKDK